MPAPLLVVCSDTFLGTGTVRAGYPTRLGQVLLPIHNFDVPSTLLAPCRCAPFLGILLACMLQSFRAGSLPIDLPCYSALVVSHALVAAASLWGTPAQMEVAMMLMYAIRSSSCCMCGLGMISCK
jgi:hypothetical protein